MSKITVIPSKNEKINSRFISSGEKDDKNESDLLKETILDKLKKNNTQLKTLKRSYTLNDEGDKLEDPIDKLEGKSSSFFGVYNHHGDGICLEIAGYDEAKIDVLEYIRWFSHCKLRGCDALYLASKYSSYKENKYIVLQDAAHKNLDWVDKVWGFQSEELYESLRLSFSTLYRLSTGLGFSWYQANGFIYTKDMYKDKNMSMEGSKKNLTVDYFKYKKDANMKYLQTVLTDNVYTDMYKIMKSVRDAEDNQRLTEMCQQYNELKPKENETLEIFEPFFVMTILLRMPLNSKSFLVGVLKAQEMIRKEMLNCLQRLSSGVSVEQKKCALITLGYESYCEKVMSNSQTEFVEFLKENNVVDDGRGLYTKHVLPMLRELIGCSQSNPVGTKRNNSAVSSQLYNMLKPTQTIRLDIEKIKNRSRDWRATRKAYYNASDSCYTVYKKFRITTQTKNDRWMYVSDLFFLVEDMSNYFFKDCIKYYSIRDNEAWKSVQNKEVCTLPMN